MLVAELLKRGHRAMRRPFFIQASRRKTT